MMKTKNEFEIDMKEQGWTERYAKTGVFQLNKVPGIWDEIDYGDNVIDLTIEAAVKEFYNELCDKYDKEHPDNELPDDYDFNIDELELVDSNEMDRYLDYCDVHNYLINYIPDPEYPGEYKEDPDAEYSAYIGETDGFVTASRYVCKAAKGSICIPNQCCLDDERSEKTEWAFTLPPEIWGEDKPEGMEIIKVDKGVYNLSGILNKL